MSLEAHELEAADAQTERVDDLVTPAALEAESRVAAETASPSFWDQLRRRLLPKSNERAEDYLRRLDLLDETVIRYPQSPSGYVLRGELHLSAGLVSQAVRDFRQGLALAESQLYTEQWGLVAQVMRDRAREGLNQALSLRHEK